MDSWLALSVSCVVVTAVGSFASSLGGELLFDDLKAINENNDVVHHAPFVEILRHDYWGTSIRSSGSHGSWRPLTTLTFRFNHELHELEPFGYHAVNVALHGLVSVLFLLLLRRILLPTDLAAATFGASLFAAIPVHCDAVASTVGRAEVLSGLFVFAGVLVHSLGEDYTSPTAQLLLLFSTAAAGATATMCKEQGAMMFVLCLALEILVASRAPVTTAPGPRRAARLGSMAGAAFAVLYLRLKVAGGVTPEFGVEQNPTAHHPEFAVRARRLPAPLPIQPCLRTCAHAAPHRCLRPGPQDLCVPRREAHAAASPDQRLLVRHDWLVHPAVGLIDGPTATAHRRHRTADRSAGCSVDHWGAAALASSARKGQ